MTEEIKHDAFEAALIANAEEVAAPVTEFGGQTNDMFAVTGTSTSTLNGFPGTTVTNTAAFPEMTTNSIPEGLNL